MATGASDGFFRGVFDGCISGGDTGVSRRPYHKNCKCALHDKSRDGCASRQCNGNKVSYPIRRSWSESSLALMAANGASGHTSPSPSCSPAESTISRTQTQLVLFREEEETDVNNFLSCPCPRSNYKV